MASLNHVCMWTEHGWTKVTAEEAAEYYPESTVSAQSGLFMCELCGQYVTLTSGSIYTRYFKHSQAEDDKSCPERTFGAYYYNSFDPTEVNLPLKIAVENNSFNLFIGFTRIPDQLFQSHSKDNMVIRGRDNDEYTYSFQRIGNDGVTYLSVGNNPAQEYHLTVSGDLTKYWSNTVNGIDYKIGSLFDKRTGKIICNDSDVEINRKYYWLVNVIPFEIRRLLNSKSIQSRRIYNDYIRGRNWTLYEIEAQELDENAARFFLSLKCRLTDSPISIRPLWPIHIETPYAVKHDSSYMLVYITGNDSVTIKTSNRDSLSGMKFHNGRLFRVDCSDKTQLISLGRSKMLQYLYFWKEPLISHTDDLFLDVYDSQGNSTENGSTVELSGKYKGAFKASYDGSIVYRTNGRISYKQAISAGNEYTVEVSTPETEVEILYGLDVVWAASFHKATAIAEEDDDLIYSKLMGFSGELVVMPHRYAASVSMIRNYPKLIKWLQSSIRRGYVPDGALRYFKHILNSIGEKDKAQ